MIKLIHHHIHHRWERFYSKSHWHLALDLSLILLIFILLGSLAALYYYHPYLPWIGSYNPPSISLDNPPLEFEYKLEKQSFEFQQGANLEIILKNNGRFELDNFSLDLKTISSDFTLSHLDLVNKNENQVSIKGREIFLSKIKAGAKIDLKFKVFFTRKNDKVRNIDWQAESQYYLSGHLLKSVSKLEPLIISAQISFHAKAYYTSPQGDQLGIGPIPPLVGIPTNYWVFWTIDANSDFSNLVISARLPQGVELATGRSLLAGKFSYNSLARQIIWKIPQFKTANNDYRLGFELQLIPTEKQFNKVPLLLKDIRYYAVDSLSKEKISGKLEDLNTNLKADHFNSGQGRVAKP